MTALAGSITWDAPAPRGFQLTLDAALQARGHVASHESGPVALAVFGSFADRGAIALRLRVPIAQLPSDPEAAAMLYRAEGTALLSYLTGDFALVIWDGDQRQLLLARNHAGTRPIYFAQNRRTVFFASDIGTVNHSAGIPLRVNEEALPAYLVGDPPPRGKTLAADVLTVPPACVTVFRSGFMETRRYWDPAACPRLDFATIEAAAEELTPLLRLVVEEMMPTMGRVAAHLTGGLDSAAVATHLTRRRATLGLELPLAYAWQPRPDSSNEGDIDQRMLGLMAEALGLDLNHVAMTRETFLESLALDPIAEPATSTLLHELSVMALAGQADVKLIMSGWGGDELISYNGRHFRAFSLRQLGSRIKHGLAEAIRGRASRKRTPRGFGSVVVRSATDRGPARSRAATARELQIELLNGGDLSERTDSWSVFGACHGLQYAFPLLDRRIMALALGMPEPWYRPGRSLMREALRGLVPEEVRLNRDKKDPARFRHLLEVATSAVRAEGTGIRVDPERMRYIDLERLTNNLVGSAPLAQPGKFLAALHFLYQPGGTPLSDAVVTA